VQNNLYSAESNQVMHSNESLQNLLHVFIGTKWRAIGVFPLRDTIAGVLKAHTAIYRIKCNMLQVKLW